MYDQRWCLLRDIEAIKEVHGSLVRGSYRDYSSPLVFPFSWTQIPASSWVHVIPGDRTNCPEVPISFNCEVFRAKNL